jgi:hypothetical protein
MKVAKWHRVPRGMLSALHIYGRSTIFHPFPTDLLPVTRKAPLTAFTYSIRSPTLLGAWSCSRYNNRNRIAEAYRIVTGSNPTLF